MNMTSVSKSLAIAFLAVIFTSCSKEQDLSGEKPGNQFFTEFNQYVKTLPSVEQMQPFAERLVGIDNAPRTAFLRATGNEKEYEQAREVDEQLLFSDANTIFYPGALIKASSIIEGTYIPIVAQRKPITISTSLIGASGKTSITVADPKLSTVRDAVSALLERDFKTPPADITYSSEEVYDEQHLRIALGANYNGTTATVKASAGFNYDTNKKKYIVKVQQVFYTLDIDPPAQPSDFFANEFEYKTAFGGKKPLYISTIKMGRVLLLGIETDMTKLELDVKLQATFGKTFDGNAETAYNDIKKRSSIRGRVIGGDAKLAGKSVSDVAVVKEFLTEGANYSKDNQGAPIAYQLRELGTNELFKTVIYSKYKKAENPAEKITFDLHIFLGALRKKSGEILNEMGRVYIQRKSLNGAISKSELFFNEYLINNNISNYNQGEEIKIIVDRRHYPNGKEHIFKLKSAFDLIKEAEIREKGRNLYDYKDNNPLVLEDEAQEYQIYLELKNQRII
ncbi:thiol-activated cytolysin family protein [Porphyromonas macacae]|uniref:thiol-activated cytolysin family protein n=1 Tax=Porphyromonas macacae TaxID=28115 RepID=UPI000690C6F7|nr:thiol-activated cytolysin family protein [Porphyromonas macacae]